MSACARFSIHLTMLDALLLLLLQSPLSSFAQKIAMDWWRAGGAGGAGGTGEWELEPFAVLARTFGRVRRIYKIFALDGLAFTRASPTSQFHFTVFIIENI